jgi:hypothetical protein
MTVMEEEEVRRGSEPKRRGDGTAGRLVLREVGVRIHGGGE